MTASPARRAFERRIIAALIFGVVVSLGIFAETGGATTKAGAQLRVSIAKDFDSADPALATSRNARMMLYASCARLYNHFGTSALVQPEIAAGLPVAGPNKDRPKQWKTYTIKLSPKYRFQSGQPVTAYSFLNTFNRDVNLDMNSPAVDSLPD